MLICSSVPASSGVYHGVQEGDRAYGGAAISRPLRWSTSDNSDMSMAATTGSSPDTLSSSPGPGLPDRAVLLSTILTISFARWQPQGAYLDVWLPLPTSLTVHPVSSNLARLGCARKVCVPGAVAR